MKGMRFRAAAEALGGGDRAHFVSTCCSKHRRDRSSSTWAGREGVRYVLLYPGVVDTGLSGDYDPEMAARVAAMRAGLRNHRLPAVGS